MKTKTRRSTVKRTVKKNADGSLTMAKDIAASAMKLKGLNVKILGLTGISTFADYFVVASGTSDRHVEAIADSIVLEMKKKGRRPFGVEGYEHSQWIIVDFGDVVAHIFYAPMREIYSIEKLWADAKVIRPRTKGPVSRKRTVRKKGR